MTRLIVLLLLAVAAWQAYIHYPSLFERNPQNEVVIRNEGDLAIDRLRLVVGGETHVREVLVPGASVTFKLDDTREVRLKLVWFGEKKSLESEWTGPTLLPDGKAERHTLSVRDNGRVSHQSQLLSSR